jgi:hypothetical protein
MPWAHLPFIPIGVVPLVSGGPGSRVERAPPPPDHAPSRRLARSAQVAGGFPAPDSPQATPEEARQAATTVAATSWARTMATPAT